MTGLPTAAALPRFDENRHPRAETGRFSTAAGYVGAAGTGLGAATVARMLVKPHELEQQMEPAVAAHVAKLGHDVVMREARRGLGMHLRRAWPLYLAGAAAGALAHHFGRQDRVGSKGYVAGRTGVHAMNMINRASFGFTLGHIAGLPLSAVLKPRAARVAGNIMGVAGAAWRARRDVNAIVDLHRGKPDPNATVD